MYIPVDLYNSIDDLHILNCVILVNDKAYSTVSRSSKEIPTVYCMVHLKRVFLWLFCSFTHVLITYLY